MCGHSAEIAPLDRLEGARRQPDHEKDEAQK